jgi:hypothetical protein
MISCRTIDESRPQVRAYGTGRGEGRRAEGETGRAVGAGKARWTAVAEGGRINPRSGERAKTRMGESEKEEGRGEFAPHALRARVKSKDPKIENRQWGSSQSHALRALLRTRANSSVVRAAGLVS